jgi:DNA-binding XRE family transcriptional regulator
MKQRLAQPKPPSFGGMLMRVRRGLQWSQDDLAARLGVSRKTVSHWECGHWLPPANLHMHIITALYDAPSEHVLAMADTLGVSAHPVAKALLASHRAALGLSSDGVARAPARTAADPTLLATVDAILRDAADTLDVSANDLRVVLAHALGACAERGATLEAARDAVAIKESRKREASAKPRPKA